MEDVLKIKVSIAQRVYPLTIKRSEEERVRNAVALINDSVARFEEKYAVQDKQDGLAMCALQMTNQALALRDTEKESENAVDPILQHMHQQLSDILR